MPGTTRLDSHRRRTRGVRGLLGVVLGVVLVYVAVSVVGGMASGASAVEHADPGWLLAALGAETAAYLLLAAQLRRTIGPDVHLPAGTACRLALILCGFGCVTPASPAEGMVITGAELRRRGVATRRVAVTLGVAELMSVVAMVALAAVNVLAAASFADLPSGTAVPLIGAAALALFALWVLDRLAREPRTAEWIAVVAGSLCFWRPRSSVGARRAVGAAWHADTSVVLGSTRNRRRLLLISVAAWLADVCCCYCALAALGVTVPFDVVLLAYTAGVAATLVPFVPAGLGLVETAMPLVLQTFGVALGAAVAAVLVYRCVSTLLPAAAGLACIPGLRRHERGAAGVPAPLLAPGRAA